MVYSTAFVVQAQVPGIATSEAGAPVDKMESACIIIGNTVTAICTNMAQVMESCQLPVKAMTTNINMAKWSRSMWQSVVNRAVRMLASGPFGSHFFSATATVDEN
ncbi:hypothetical protein KIN20_010809 [Parelaphostrongylus tenuis]|uniref:Uncharacterized protein n=1 Tax=Parelaphostrongylus tenuis TaxID=148309 RepID=A0AAD5QM21_PARTN|nr:hypothetical protein KIN20_010809 [Parelaphostrongylus tenuis]